MGRAGGRSRRSTTGNQLVCRRTQAVLQSEDRLIQGSPSYRLHDRGTPQVRIGQDSEKSFAGEVLVWAIQTCVTPWKPEGHFENMKRIHKCLDELQLHKPTSRGNAGDFMSAEKI